MLTVLLASLLFVRLWAYLLWPHPGPARGVCIICAEGSARASEDPSSSVLCRPLCRFKSCPSEPADSSCSIFIKPLSLKEPYPDHGKTHSSRSPLSCSLHLSAHPAAACSPFSLSFSLTPLPPLSISPSLSLSFSLTHTFTYIHSDTFSPTHIYINTHIHDTHMLMHMRPLISVQHTCAGWGGVVLQGLFWQCSLWVCCAVIWERSGSQLFSLSSSSHSWNAKTGLMDISELCLPDPLSYHNQ